MKSSVQFDTELFCNSVNYTIQEYKKVLEYKKKGIQYDPKTGRAVYIKSGDVFAIVSGCKNHKP